MKVIETKKMAQEFARVIGCRACASSAGPMVLRDDTFNLPQPGYVGPRYAACRLLLVGQNPGVSPVRFDEQDREYASALVHVRDGPSPESLGRLQEVLGRIIPTWPVHGNYFPLAECGLTLADIAYVNAVRCRTPGNRAPSSGVSAMCISRHFARWLDMLGPKAVVCIGKWAYDRVAELLAQHGIPCDFVNRQRSLPGRDRTANRAQIKDFVQRHVRPGTTATVPVTVAAQARRNTTMATAERSTSAGYEERSGDFAPLFRDLGVEFAVKGRHPHRIDNNKVLKRRGVSLKLYFNEATQTHPAYFAARPDFYADHGWQGWEDVHSDTSQKEKSAEYFLKMPLRGREMSALRCLLAYARTGAV